MVRRTVSILFSLAILLSFAGCGTPGDTAAGHGLALPQGSESVVPLPSQAAIVMSEAADETAVVLFRPGLNWPESVTFFTQGFEGRGWTLEEQDIPELDQGERTAAWRAVGHGVRVTVNVTAFGGPEGANLSGVLMVEPQD